MQTPFDFTCPKCQHVGDSDELACFNCKGKIEAVLDDSFAIQDLLCVKCGLSQMPSCPTQCGALITRQSVGTNDSSASADDTDSLFSADTWWVIPLALVIGYFLFFR